MGPLEYLLLFAAIILGLAVADLATSLHRLLGAGARVAWDWLAPLAALVAFLKIVTLWWSWFGIDKLARGLTWEMFLGFLAGTVLLFLMAATALPDEVPDGTIDLRAHYAAVQRRYWILFAAEWLLMNLLTVWAQVQILGAHFQALSPAYLVLPLAVSLIFVRNRWWHTACLVGLAVIYVGQFAGHALAG